MRIDRDGGWHYRGSPIGRLPLVKLFATVLRRAEDGSYWLVTPVEQGRIEVEDVPFVAVELQSDGRGRRPAAAVPHQSRRVGAARRRASAAARPAHGDAAVPYLLVRDRLEARIARSVYYQLVELAEPAPGATPDVIGVWSGGRFCPAGRGR